MSGADISQEEEKGKPAELSHGEEASKKENGKEAVIDQGQKDQKPKLDKFPPTFNPVVNQDDINKFGLAGAVALSYWDAGLKWAADWVVYLAEPAIKDLFAKKDDKLADKLRGMVQKFKEIGEKVDGKIKGAMQSIEKGVKSAFAKKSKAKMSMAEAAQHGAEGEKKAKTVAGEVKSTQGKKAKTQEERKGVSETKKRVLKLVRTPQGKRYAVAPKDKEKLNAAAAAARKLQADGKSA